MLTVLFIIYLISSLLLITIVETGISFIGIYYLLILAKIDEEMIKRVGGLKVIRVLIVLICLTPVLNTYLLIKSYF